MKTRRLGKTNLQVSEIGFGGEWLERHPEEESIELIRYASSKGINILDCWMADPKWQPRLAEVCFSIRRCSRAVSSSWIN